MRKLIFSGRVLPERAAFDIPKYLDLSIVINGDELIANTRLHIHANQIVATVDVPPGTIDLPTVRNHIESAARILVDYCGFRVGHSYDVEITSVLDSDTNRVTVFGVNLPVVPETLEGNILGDTKTLSVEILSVIVRSPYIQRALSDFREAMRKSADTGFFCYRAIESIMQSFKDANSIADENIAWQTMRDALNIDKDWLMYLHCLAKAPRHGAPVQISWQDRQEAMKRTWTVIARFMIFLKRNRGELTEPEFPKLTSTL